MHKSVGQSIAGLIQKALLEQVIYDIQNTVEAFPPGASFEQNTGMLKPFLDNKVSNAIFATLYSILGASNKNSEIAKLFLDKEISSFVKPVAFRNTISVTPFKGVTRLDQTSALVKANL
ncbi:hypothetical protein [Wolbachia pipientis]|uniref:hypothetical protein n=1 Tax=Wolbachia pipientis TaxID=955 RepID=UPI0025A3AAB5|nr:hypothetical protein [Wolbachia pipientis]MDM8334895.1 hypothetical protein [Wolbachia pipientis]